MDSKIQKELERDYENGMYRRLGISFDRFMDERCEQAKQLHAMKQAEQAEQRPRKSGRQEKQKEVGENEG